MRRDIFLILLGSLMILFCIGSVDAFSWGGNEGRSTLLRSLEEHVVGSSISIQDRSRLPNVYAVAMQELQELESEPLCHRIAARLLVNNCQLLDGKDDATVLTDSGRQVRDFVDSYAASLAICDLERGSFAIPSSCAPFRERSLANIPDSSIPRLHASPQQIDSCLSGLAKSDSAWNTWVSYRHKALRFCEAARADNEKAQSIRLHQRLTEVLSKLSEGVEQELEAHLRAINIRATETTDQLRHMIPDIEQLRNNLRDLDRAISEDVMQISRASNAMIKDGLEDARSLHQLLGVLLKTVTSNNAEVAASQEMALENLRENTNSEIAIVVSTLATAAASSASLQSLMVGALNPVKWYTKLMVVQELSHVRVVELANRQEHLEKGLVKLLDIAEELSSRYESHTEKLDLAQQTSNDLLETLDDMVTSTSEVRNSLGHGASWTSWMPYFICPAASLLMGSYGLPPSAIRNIGLIVLGEIVGFIISYAQNFTLSIFNISRIRLPPAIGKNTTFAFRPAETDILQSLPSNLRNAR